LGLSAAKYGAPTVTRVPLAPVFFFVGCPAVPFSLGAFGWAARFVGTLLFASLPSTFKIGAPVKRQLLKEPKEPRNP
jgi:hypothetical protein